MNGGCKKDRARKGFYFALLPFFAGSYRAKLKALSSAKQAKRHHDAFLMHNKANIAGQLCLLLGNWEIIRAVSTIEGSCIFLGGLRFDERQENR